MHYSFLKDKPSFYLKFLHLVQIVGFVRAVLYFVPKCTAVHNKTGYTTLAEDEKPPVVLDYIVYPVLLCTAVHFGTKYKTALRCDCIESARCVSPSELQRYFQ